ncbi:Uncharacterized protein OBRU01_20183 [Operophtera brumata]|uniref:Uncharacterized protein n=1 Tax=Operophtera brumata TaxID=104452 RepID=A0A0L7KV27_OPEBR|nr:Uncharacterized protein OBRU01_20183 [Operophtera brumata]
MEYSSHILLALVVLNLASQGYSAPTSRSSKAAAIPEDTQTARRSRAAALPEEAETARRSKTGTLPEESKTSKLTSRRSKASVIPDEVETSSRDSKLEDKFKELPTTSQAPPSNRKNKALNLFGFYPSFLSSGFDFPEDDDDDNVNFTVNDDNFEEEDLSRTIPSRRRQNNKKKNGNGESFQNDNLNSLQYDNSPIFYIRLPPTPYMFVPGLGYVSQPPSIGPPMSPMMPQGPPQVADPFINLPLDFVSNGKPTGVYQWSGGPAYPQVPQMPVDPYGFGAQQMMPRPTYTMPSYSQPKPKPKPAPSNSKVTNLKGQYMFNGKPGDSVYVLRDTYNSIYSDALQNFYP